MNVCIDGVTYVLRQKINLRYQSAESIQTVFVCLLAFLFCPDTESLTGTWEFQFSYAIKPQEPTSPFLEIANKDNYAWLFTNIYNKHFIH